MANLPRIFEKVRFSIAPNLRPNVILNLSSDTYSVVDAEIRNFYEKNPGKNFQLSLRFWTNFWFESVLSKVSGYNGKPTRKWAAHCYAPADATDFGQLTVTIFNNDGEHRGKFQMKDYWFGLSDRPEFMDEIMSGEQKAYEGLAAALAYALHFYSARTDETVNVISEYGAPLSDNDVQVYGKIGDTFRYERLKMDRVRRLYAKLPEPAIAPDNDGPAYHKRQHEVIGHWRQYKSGRRVFIHAHKRGNPELGVITKIYR